MLRISIIIVFSVLFFNGISQEVNRPKISEMKWGADFNIHIQFSNDSTSIYDVKGLYHSPSYSKSADSDQITYYPVTLDQEFIDALKNRKIESFVDTIKTEKQAVKKGQTLWSALHGDLGGGWIHFINCLVYSYETGQLKNKAPLMQRPESNWKPNPMTESYKRTRKWSYYIPDNQKLAIKEYKIRNNKGELGNLALLPPFFTELFLTTNQKKYDKLVEDKQLNKIAIIDMIRLLLASKYLGQEQIDYIRGAVLKAVMQYSVNSLPSVIIFDDFDAAVAMTLDENGYKIGKVVFNNESELTTDEVDQRIERMEGIINQINKVNKKVFEKNLKKYYQ